MNSLEKYGWNEKWTDCYSPYKNTHTIPARIIREGKGLFHAITEKGKCLVELSGGLRNLIELGVSDQPVIGDWCAIHLYSDDRGLIESILPREKTLHRPVSKDERRVIKDGRIVASNIEIAAVVIDVANESTLRRAERFLTLLSEDDIPAILILSKIDLIENPQEIYKMASSRFPCIPVILVDSLHGIGKEELDKHLTPAKTMIILGPSGAGKSTLINMLAQNPISITGEVRENDGRGRHTTTARELYLLSSGALLVDTPGIRSLGTFGVHTVNQSTVTSISVLSKRCKFSNCTHTNEPGCEVIKALKEGKINEDIYNNFLTIQSESMSKDEMISKKREQEKNIAKIKYKIRREK